MTLLWDTQGEVEGDDLGFEKARRDVISKMASWSDSWHGSREYMLCYAAGGSRLRFYAVKNGGTHAKPISEDFCLRYSLHRLKVSLLPMTCVVCCCLGVHFTCPSLAPCHML